jgi:hypothetical protein
MQQSDGQKGIELEDGKGTVHIVVEGHTVYAKALGGYTLVAVVYTDLVVLANEADVLPPSQPGWSATNIQRTVARVVREPRFVMRLDRDSALAEKEEQLVAARAAAAEANNELRAEKQRAAVLAKDNEKLSGEREKLSVNYRSAMKNYEDQRDMRRKLEGDIAKIRSAVGEIRMKEILGT